ncbi:MULTISPECIES: DUF6565 domain-containing protein [Parabacteroides]|jgi:uncharacterized protein YxeA|uniref:DUF6565 domain-containing protein n=3 Tax=Parabacteroides goldsteinii TaxID=328812 RepID=A0A6G1ZJI0_9BACT|nr:MULTISPECIES: DUF6565 domain-containing protein [Parabacteroides]EOS18273.1 hypothetical protein C803_01935 [Parabacteroides goldsteinii dnLKV18]KAI4362109.1 hypothetical protein C825_004187 [Parabacteroides sp. ASF519]MBF0767361.1 hypothetical protein [Parabacteroides goldsteinii]MBS6577600.1 hypothetical protein [Parabacteroides goldsteinii]MDZ3928239.1 DUF6565 domain-containing protein [Parabacteroides goldsteinii]
MKRFLMMMVAVMALFTLSGCGESKESYVKDFTKFVEKVQAGADKYSKADWEEVEKKYIEFAETKYDKYSSELSTDEMIGITKLKATYLTIQTKHGIIDNILKDGNNALDLLIK